MQTITLINGKVRELHTIKNPLYTEDGSAAFKIEVYSGYIAVRYDLEYKWWSTYDGTLFIPVKRWNGELIGFVDAEVELYTTRKCVIVNSSNIELERYYK